MALLVTKSTFLLLIITLAFSSHGVVKARFFRSVFKSFGGNKVPIMHTEVNPVPRNKGYPETKGLDETPTPNVSKTTGVDLAIQFFGPPVVKGFRWGWKATRYYLKIVDMCEKYQQLLKPYCIPQSYSLRPDCVLKCIVVTSMNTTVDNTPTSCYDSCDDPVEAKCDETLTDYECSKLING
ncbi:hypothetical protein R6Q59_019026 [Mikania micrantha]|uniref:Uncharacterized protein n=1 Tax=Mikania micrantha TaxID=192012 RepID=A0A5N6M1D8_9ASTR|nr:hypothetical protein E3N88_34643 [Mikania micrantha]